MVNVKGGVMEEQERLMAERVSCAAAGGLLLIALGSVVAGALMRWPWLRAPAAMLAAWAVGAVAAAVVWARCYRKADQVDGSEVTNG